MLNLGICNYTKMSPKFFDSSTLLLVPSYLQDTRRHICLCCKTGDYYRSFLDICNYMKKHPKFLGMNIHVQLYLKSIHKRMSLDFESY